MGGQDLIVEIISETFFVIKSFIGRGGYVWSVGWVWDLHHNYMHHNYLNHNDRHHNYRHHNYLHQIYLHHNYRVGVYVWSEGWV